MGDSLTEFFGDLDDPRWDQGQRHPLVSLIGIAIIGVLCGADEWTEVEEVAWLKADWLRRFLDLPHGIPSHDTLSRVFGLLAPEAFSQALLGWIQHVAALSRGELVSIDGRTLRRSYDTAKGQRYDISSLKGPDAAHLLNTSRGHWGIENRLHWSLDVTFHEDHSRVRKDHGPANIAALRRAVLRLLKQETSAKTSLKSKRRRCAMAHDYLETVLSLP